MFAPKSNPMYNSHNPYLMMLSRGSRYSIALLLLFSISSIHAQVWDDSFADDGRLTLSVYEEDQLHAARFVDGRLIVAYSNDYGDDPFFVRAYEADGSVDLTFQPIGVLGLDLPFLEDGGLLLAQTATIMNDGIYLSTMCKVTSDFTTYDYMAQVLKYNTNGSLNTSFGDNGLATAMVLSDVPNMFWSGGFTGSLEVNDGIILLGNSNDTLCFVKFFDDGSLDFGFGENGIKKLENDDLVLPEEPGEYGFRKWVYFNNQVYCQLSVTTLDNVLFTALIRFNADGSQDMSFGNNQGYVDLVPYCYFDGQYNWNLSVLQAIDEYLYLGSHFELYRFNSNFEQDMSFGGTGLGYASLSNGVALSLTKDSQGRFYVPGVYATDPSIPRCLRLLSNGAIDTSFGDEGLLIYETPVEDESVWFEFCELTDEGEPLIIGMASTGFGAGNIESDAVVLKILVNDNSVESLRNSDGVFFYPNPVSDFITLPNIESGNMIIRSLDGKIVRIEKFSQPTRNRTLDVSSLQQGTYILEVVGDSCIHKTKFIKL